MAEKMLRELTQLRNGRGRTVTTSRGGNVDGSVGVEALAIEDSASSSYEIEHRSPDTQCEADGGVRLAGERPGEVFMADMNLDSLLEGSILPPPYSEHFRET